MSLEKLTLDQMKVKTIKTLPKDMLDECRKQISNITNPSTSDNERKLYQKEFANTIVKLSNSGHYTEYLSTLYEKYAKQYGDW